MSKVLKLRAEAGTEARIGAGGKWHKARDTFVSGGGKGNIYTCAFYPAALWEAFVPLIDTSPSTGKHAYLCYSTELVEGRDHGFLAHSFICSFTRD